MRAKVYFLDNGLFTNKIINTSYNNSLSFHILLINTLLFDKAKSLRPDYTATVTFDVGDLGGQRIVGTLLNVFLVFRILLILFIA